MRKLGIALAVVLVLVIAAIATLPYLLDVNSYRDRIQSELQARTGRSVSLGQMHLKVFPFAFRVQNAVLGEDPRFPSKAPFAQASELLVSVKLLPLLSKRIEVDSVELKNPKIELIRNQEGQWNYASIGKPQTAATPQQPAKPAPAQPQPQQPQPAPEQKQQQFELGRLLIDDGQVAITDYKKRQARTVYDHIDLDLRGYAPGKPVNIDLAAHLPGAGKQGLRLTGKGGPMQDDPLATNFDGTLNLDGVSLAGLKKFANSSALEGMDFTATGKSDITNKNGVLSAKGNITLQNPRVKNVNIGYPISADFDVIDDLKSDVITVNKGALRLGNTPVDIKGSINAGSTPAKLDVRALVKSASIADAAKLAGAFGVAFNPGMQVAGTVDADMTARGTSSAPIMNGTLAARDLVISGKQLAQPVHVTQVSLQLSPKQVKSNEFVASTGSTSVHAAFTMNDYSAPSSTIDATVKAPGAQLGELIAIGQAYGVEALDGMAGTGAVNIDVRVTGPTKNPAAIQYAGSGNLRNASITLPSLTKPVQVNNADLQFSKNAVILNNAAFGVGSTQANGQLTIRSMTSPTPQANFALNVNAVNVEELKGLMKKPPAARADSSFSIIPVAHAADAAQPSLLERLTGGGNIAIGRVVSGALELTNVKTTATLDKGLIRLNPLTANLYGGVESGTVVIDTRPTPVTYTVNTKLTGVDANKLLSSVSNLKQTLFGILAANADTRFTGSTSGNSSDIARTLNGTVNLNLQNGKLAGIDMLNQLATIGKFLNVTKQSEPFTNITKLTGNFVVRNGVAHTDNLVAAIDGGTLGAKGDVDLANQTINMAATAVLPQQVAQQVGGTNIGGYLNTALANSKGELVMPVTITGSMTKPTVQPDYNAIAQMKVQNVLPALTSGGGISSILGALTGKQNQQQQPSNAQQGQQQQAGQQPAQQGQQQQQQNKPANVVQDVLDIFGGKQKKQQPDQQQPQQNPPPDEKLPDPSNPKH